MIADIVITLSTAGLERAAMVIVGASLGFVLGITTTKRSLTKR